MALIKCPECNIEIEDTNKYCLNCGFPLNECVNIQNVKKDTNSTIYTGIDNLFSKLNVNIRSKLYGVIFGALAIVNFLTLAIYGLYFLSVIFETDVFNLLNIYLEMIGYGSIIVGFVLMSVRSFQKKKDIIAEISPFSIAIGYGLIFVVTLINLFGWFSLDSILDLFLGFCLALIWILSSKLNVITYFKNSVNKRVILFVLSFALMLTRIISYFIFDIGTYFLFVPMMSILFEWISFVIVIVENTNLLDGTVMASSKLENKYKNYITDYKVLKNTNGYVPVYKILLFSILTFNIYMYFWIYKNIEFFNSKRIGKQKSQRTHVILCLLVPFYIVYWIYTQCKLIETYSKEIGDDSNNISVLSLILSLFGLSLVSISLMQYQINNTLLKEKEKNLLKHNDVETYTNECEKEIDVNITQEISENKNDVVSNSYINENNLALNKEKKRLCIECGNELNADDKVCPNCGYEESYRPYLHKLDAKNIVKICVFIVMLIIAMSLVTTGKFQLFIENISYYHEQYLEAKSHSSGFLAGSYLSLASKWEELRNEAIFYVVTHSVGAFVLSVIGGCGLYRNIKKLKNVGGNSNGIN